MFTWTLFVVFAIFVLRLFTLQICYIRLVVTFSFVLLWCVYLLIGGYLCDMGCLLYWFSLLCWFICAFIATLFVYLLLWLFTWFLYCLTAFVCVFICLGRLLCFCVEFIMMFAILLLFLYLCSCCLLL